MDKILQDLAFHPYKLSFIKAIDTTLRYCDIDVTNVTLQSISVVKFKCRIAFRQQWTDVHSIDGIIEKVPEITLNLPGVAGINGLLPSAYTEYYILHNKINKTAVEEFLNVFNAHFISLKYVYCKNYVLQYTSCPAYKTSFCQLADALSGLWQYDALMEKAMIPLDFKIAAFGLFWQKTRSAFGLKSLLDSYFGLDVFIEQFAGSFTQSVAESDRTKIGTFKGKYNNLGVETLLGEKAWNESAGINIHVKNLTMQEYTKFLPKISKLDQRISPLQKMKTLVKMYLPKHIKIKIIFSMNQRYTVQTNLTRSKRLNNDAFLGKKSMPTTFTEIVR